MKFAAVIESGQGVPPNIYQAVFESVVPAPANVEKGFPPGYLFTFKVTEGPHAGAKATRIPSGERPTSKNALSRFLSELTGVPLAAGVEYDVESCIGKPYTIVVKPGKGGGTRVENVIRPK